MDTNRHILVTEQTPPCDKFGGTCGGSDDTSETPAPLFSRRLASVGHQHVPVLIIDLLHNQFVWRCYQVL